MTDKEKAASLLPKKPTASKTKPTASSQSTNNNIDENAAKVKGENKKKSTDTKKKKKRGSRLVSTLTMEKQSSSFSFKFYAEQVPNGDAELRKAVRMINKLKCHAFLIYHDKDEFDEDFWGKATEKPHYHLIILVVERDANSKYIRLRTRQVLNWVGVVYREEVDDKIWANHGAESVYDREGAVVYLRHKTPAAIADLKHEYDVEELVSNISREEIERIYEIPYQHRVEHTVKADNKEALKWTDEARKAGFDKKPFEDFIDTVPVSVRTQSGSNRVIREEYERGLQLRMIKEKTLIRTCIFIEGPPDVGKTFAAKKVMDDWGKTYISLGPASGSGAYDVLKPTHDAIIYDDTKVKEIIQISDNYVTRVHRRNNNDPYWAGEYVIVTSNLSFRDWLKRCGIYDTVTQDAVESRFFGFRIIDTGDDIKCERVLHSERGVGAETDERFRRVIAFLKPYLECMRDYQKNKSSADKIADYMAQLDEIGGMPSITYKQVEAPTIQHNSLTTASQTEEEEDTIPFGGPEDKEALLESIRKYREKKQGKETGK